MLSQRMCSDFFFNPKKSIIFYLFVRKKCGERPRWKPSMLDTVVQVVSNMPEESSRCISEGVTEHVFVQVSETKPGLAYEFSTQRSVGFFTPFGKRLSKIKSPKVTRCLSFFEFSIFVFLLASYPKFQIHIPIDTFDILCIQLFNPLTEAETPRMSSYLLGFAIGDFSVLRLESKSPVPMALYAQRGQVWMDFSMSGS